MPKTTKSELHLFCKLLKIRRVLKVVNTFEFHFSRSVGRNCQYGKYNRGYVNCAFIVILIFFSFGNDDDTFTNGLFGMDCLQDSKAVITSYIFSALLFSKTFDIHCLFYVNNDLETDCRGILTTVFVLFCFFHNLSAWNHTANIDEEEFEPRLYL